MGPEVEVRLYTLPWMLLNFHFQSDGALDPGLVPQPFVAMEQIWNYIIAHWTEDKISAHNSGFLFFSSATWQVDQHTPPCAGFSKTLPSMRSSGKLCICRFGFLVCFSGGLFCVCACVHSSCECMRSPITLVEGGDNSVGCVGFRDYTQAVRLAWQVLLPTESLHCGTPAQVAHFQVPEQWAFWRHL